MVAAIEYSTDLRLSRDDLAKMQKLAHLSTTHQFMMNDLYSYEKENCELKQGGSVSNAVLVIQNQLNVSPLIAKSILQNMIWDIEFQMDRFWNQLRDDNEVNEQQLEYAHCLMDSAAGNVFFSATAPRYAKYAKVEGDQDEPES
jgi:hypothetical protein